MKLHQRAASKHGRKHGQRHHVARMYRSDPIRSDLEMEAMLARASIHPSVQLIVAGLASGDDSNKSFPKRPTALRSKEEKFKTQKSQPSSHPAIQPSSHPSRTRATCIHTVREGEQLITKEKRKERNQNIQNMCVSVCVCVRARAPACLPACLLPFRR